MTGVVGGSESRRTSGFPAELTSFVGRRDEAAEVRRLLSAGRLLTLTGPGGVGKTRLAGHVAEQVARSFPDGVWLVPLAALRDEAFVPHAVNDALGVRNETVRPPLDVLVEYLRNRRSLIVLDNCEHVPRSCATLAGTVLAATEDVRILATSRHRLGLVGERLFEVPPLPAPEAEELGPAAVETFPALRLFADRAAAVVPGFTVGTANQRAVARLCRRLDGLPLAIELAAVRVRALGVEQLVERLDDRYRLLTCGSPTSAPRHRTLRSAVDWSHELCTPEEQTVWARLSVFVGGFDLAAAEAVCGEVGTGGHGTGGHGTGGHGTGAGGGGTGAGATGGADVLDAVAGLVDKSVLVREEHDGRVRYRLLVSLRDYGLEKLNDLGETVATRRRHRDHFARLGAEYERAWFGPDQVDITERLRIDQDDFRAALDFCLTTPGEAQHGLRLASTLWFHWVAYGAWGEGRHWMDGALLAGARPDESLTRALWTGALTSLVHSRSAAVLAGLDPERHAPADDRELPVPAPPPLTLGPDRARTSSASFVVLTRVELACTLVSRGRAADAIPLCAEAVALCEAHGEQWARSWALRTLALAHWSAGEYERAAEHARACLRLPYTARQHQSLARTLDLLAAAEALAGRAERAAVLHGAVDRIRHAIGGDCTTARRAGRPGVAEHRARQVLGDPAYERARRRGAGLSPEESVAYALAEGGERAGTAALREDAVAHGSPVPSAPRGAAPAAHAGPAPVGRTGPAPAVPMEPAPDLRVGRYPAGNPAPGSAATAGPPADPVPLTRRELQVAALVAQGRTNKQIADHLVIARRTAEGHVERILAKLGFRNRSQVAAWFSARSWS